MIMEYHKRIVEKEIEIALNISGAVVIEGCKWCGKSTTAKQFAKTIVEFQDPDKRLEYENIKDTKLSLFLIGDKPILFDEWQMYPVLWDAIRTDVDRTGHKGDYILTGSTKPYDDLLMHSGTGRFSKIIMRPMTLSEYGDSNKQVSFRDIINGKNIQGKSVLEIEDIAKIIVRGGFPGTLEVNEDSKYKVVKEYFKSVINEEINSVDKRERNPEKMKYVLKSLSRNVSTQVSNETIMDDVVNLFGDSISKPTLNDYLNTLERLYILYNIPFTNMNFRSKSQLRIKPKRELVDPSLACAALSLGDGDLMKDLCTFGFLFECLCMRDLKTYAEVNDIELGFYRDENDLEVDCIMKMPNGEWAACEIKLGAGQVEKAIDNLKLFAKKMELLNNKPKFLMVLYGGKFSYVTDDGVYVVSIGNLCE